MQNLPPHERTIMMALVENRLLSIFVGLPPSHLLNQIPSSRLNDGIFGFLGPSYSIFITPNFMNTVSVDGLTLGLLHEMAHIFIYLNHPEMDNKDQHDEMMGGLMDRLIGEMFPEMRTWLNTVNMPGRSILMNGQIYRLEKKLMQLIFLIMKKFITKTIYRNEKTNHTHCTVLAAVFRRLCTGRS